MSTEPASTPEPPSEGTRKRRHPLRWIVALLFWTLWAILLLGVTAWGAAAIWVDGPSARWAAGALAALSVVVSIGLPLFVWHSPRLRPVTILPFAVVLGWWLAIPASNDRDWTPDVARLPRAEIEGSKVTVHNLRNFTYRGETDFTENWETRTLDLDLLTGIDIFLCFWGPTLYCHTIMSWQFSDGQHLAVSIETRKEKGEEYSAVLGFFRQFELYYVVADERDVIGLRTNCRGEDVYLYRLRREPGGPRALLLQYLATINSLVDEPRWYNALTENCTTSIFHNIRAVAPDRPWDWRLLANGYLPELGYERGAINTTLPLENLKKQSFISERAKKAGVHPDFSELIREGIPERPPDRRPTP